MQRARTWLLVPERQRGEAQLRSGTRTGAHGRIVGTFAYSPTGREAPGDVRIAGNDITETYVRAVLDPEGRSRRSATPRIPMPPRSLAGWPRWRRSCACRRWPRARVWVKKNGRWRAIDG